MSKMMKIISLLGIVLFVFIIQGCGPKPYVHPDFQKITGEHHLVAVLPFFVTIEAGKLPKDITQESINQMQQDEGYTFQQQLYSKLLQRQAKGDYTIEFQDVDQTNALLAKQNITYDNIGQYTKADIGKILEVDAILSGNIRRSKPMSTGGAIATAIIFGVSGSTNRVDVNMNLHDAKNGTLLWKLDHEEDGGLGSSSEGLAKSCMKVISKKFPYKSSK